MDKLQLLAVSKNIMDWAIPVAIIIASTFAGWVLEQVVIRWTQRIAHRMQHPRENIVGKAVRGHVTFWGFLLGVGIAANTAIAQQLTAETIIANKALSDWIHNGLLALFLISFTFMLAGVVTALIAGTSASTSRPVVSLVSNVSRFIVLVIGFLLVMSIFDVNITPWLTTLGVAGLAVSLALQATLTDLVSGMLLLATHQITVGDYVKLSSGEEGYITDISWRTTTIRQLSNNITIVPNSKMTSSSLTDYYTTSQTTSVLVNMGVSYDSDLDKVERVTIEVAQDVMKTVKGGMPDFQPFIRYNTLGDFSINFTVIMQGQEVTDQYLIKHEFVQQVINRYREEGISIPFPVRTVQLLDSSRDAASSSTEGASDALQASANSSDASSR